MSPHHIAFFPRITLALRRLFSWLACVWLSFASLGCNPAAQPAPPAPAARAAPASPGPTVTPAPTSARSPAPAATGEPVSQRFPGTQFPPPAVTPPSKTTAHPGDGQWIRMGDALRGERAAEDPAILYRTVLHPHPVSRFMSVTIAAIDLRHAQLHLAAGIDDPGVEGLPSSAPPGLVPERHRDELVVVLNGGFQPKHGRWGMRVGGVTLMPPRDGGCTILLEDSGVRISGEVSPPVGHAFRQTPPCLLEGGELHPHLRASQERAWGGRDPKRKTRRRSALGIDASGRTLFYGMGTEVGPTMLARALQLAGAVAAAQLDINWSWTKFLLMGEPSGGALQVTSTLIPKMVHAKAGYVHRPAHRDFFYLTRR